MRTRHAATALVALGAASACAIGVGLVHQADVERESDESALRSSAWSVQASHDFGTSWNAPVSSSGGSFPVRVDTALLRSRPTYQPLTLRTTVNSQTEARVSVGTGALVEGDPATASAVRIRAVASREGTCAAPAFAGSATSILDSTTTPPDIIDAPTAGDPLVLPAATRTTSGAPVTICLEVNIDPNAPVADSVVTFAWSLDITRGGADS